MNTLATRHTRQRRPGRGGVLCSFALVSLLVPSVLAPQRATVTGSGSDRAALLQAGKPGLMGAMTIPNHIAVDPATMPAGATVTITVSVTQAPADGSDVQVSCTRTDLLQSPSGSWPYRLHVDSGSTSASFTATVSSSAGSASVTVCACQTGMDISNPANWQAAASVATTPATVNP